MKINTFIIPMDPDPVALLAIEQDNRYLSYLCFDHVGVISCLRPLKIGSAQSQDIQSLIERLELRIPDFSSKDVIEFDFAMAQKIMVLVLNVRQIVDFDKIKQYYDEYKESNYKRYSFPKSDSPQVGLYIDSNAKQLAVINSRLQAQEVISDNNDFGILPIVNNINLPEESLYPQEWLYDEAADVIGFLFWLEDNCLLEI
jgi:hypothetical protein